MVHVVSGQRQPLSSLTRDQKIALVREHGAVLFRGFDVDTAAFRRVAEELGRDFYNMSLDPRIRELVSSDGMVAGVIKGTRALPLHMERGYSPLKPELVMFHVVKPSASGGESLLCNGTRVLDELAPATLDRFRNKRLKYRHTWEPEAWQGRYGRTPDDVARLFATIPDVAEFHFEGDLLHYSYVVSAIVRSRLGGREAFCNNLEGAWRVQHGSAETRPAVHDHAVMFEDDEPITEALVQEVHDAVARATQAQAIEAADVFVIDNYRYMHGRAAFEGERTMHTIMADAGF
jgi:alpha-ketoglutarate-dependent taurine dioxygenase